MSRTRRYRYLLETATTLLLAHDKLSANEMVTQWPKTLATRGVTQTPSVYQLSRALARCPRFIKMRPPVWTFTFEFMRYLADMDPMDYATYMEALDQMEQSETRETRETLRSL